MRDMKSRLFSALVAALMALVFVGCASTTEFEKQRMALNIGMSRAEVDAVITSNPTQKTARNGSEYLIYKEFNRAPSYLKFTNGKLTEWGTWSFNTDKPASDDVHRIESDSTIKIE